MTTIQQPENAIAPPANSPAEPEIVLDDVCKIFGEGENAIVAVNHVSVRIERGEFVAFMGPSGSGKTTTMNVIGCIDHLTSGSYRLRGVDVSHLTDLEQARKRLLEIGFVFQGFNLLARLSALENVQLPLIYAGIRGSERRRRAVEALEAVGLGARMDHRPSQLSGGQQQRVAIARALINRPSLILADEPTGALDTRTSHEVMQLLSGLNRRGITIVLVTHEPDVAAYAERVLTFRDGSVVAEGQSAQDLSIATPSEVMRAAPKT